jgi:membrane protease YdiL (CAAX protease family)
MLLQLGAVTRTPVRRREIGVFLAIAFGLPWLLWLLRLFTGIDILAAGSMVAVGIATFVTVRWVSRPTSIIRETGIRPIRPAVCALVLGLLLGMAALSIGIGAVVGISPLDLVNFSGAHKVYGSTPLVLAAAQSVLFFVVLIPLAFCEEWGWRGFLLPRLLKLGIWPAMLLSGVIWACWHLPGYFGTHARTGFVPFLIFCVLFGTVLGWIRLKSQSVWPTTVAHAANNTITTGFINVAFVDAHSINSFNPWSYGLSGWPGWLVISTVIIFLAVTGKLYART